MIFLYKLLNEIDLCTFVLNHENKVIWVNKEAEILLENINFINKNFEEISDIEIYKKAKKTYMNIKDKGKFIITETVIEQGDISKILLLKPVNSFEKNSIKAYVFEKILNSINDGVIITDYKGEIVFFNNTQEEVENKKSKDMIGKYLWDVYGYDSEDKSEHRKVFREGKPILNKYRLHTYKNGLPRYISYCTYPIVKDNEIIGVYSISRNEEKLHTQLSEVIDIKRKYNRIELVESEKKLQNGTMYSFTDIVGSSEETQKLIKEAENIAILSGNILIIGETGTGKEVYAQSIHNYSKKRTEPFIAINCAAIPENLIESILFGTVKGAYTGAVDTVGLFEKAGEGTLFLDELNSMPVYMQTKLLRVLQEKKVRRVGDLNVYPISCRVVSAINEDPKKLMERELLRKDLFYRISGLTIYIPALRERKKDIDDLIDFFIKKYNLKLKTNISRVSDNLKKKLLEYNWPGNIREFEYFMKNLMIRVNKEKKILTIKDLPSHLITELESDLDIKGIDFNKDSLTSKLNSIEKNIILNKLEQNEWNISKTARELKIIRQSLLYRMKRLNIKKSK